MSRYYTLAEAAEILKLETVVVRQLGRILDAPKAYYAPEAGQPAMFLFSESEMTALLKRCRYFQQTKAYSPVEVEGFSPQSVREFLAEATEYTQELAVLEDVWQQETAKKALAERSMALYASQQKPKTPVLKNLATRLAWLRRDGLQAQIKTLQATGAFSAWQVPISELPPSPDPLTVTPPVSTPLQARLQALYETLRTAS